MMINRLIKMWLQYGSALGNTCGCGIESGACLVVAGTSSVVCRVAYWNDGTIRFRITTKNPKPISKRLIVLGSGALTIFAPAVVPNKNVAPVIEVEAVTPVTSTTNVAVWFRKGL